MSDQGRNTAFRKYVLPRLVELAADGKTRMEAAKIMDMRYSSVVNAAKKYGIYFAAETPVGYAEANGRIQIATRLEADVFQRAVDEAKANGISLSKLIREIVTRHVTGRTCKTDKAA